MKTTSTNANQEKVKKTSLKARTTSNKPSVGKSSITDKSTAKATTAAHHTAAKPSVSDKTAASKSEHRDNATAVKAPSRRKRIIKKVVEIQDIVLYEHTGGMLNGFSILVGLFLLAEGIWGLQSNVVFNVFTTNQTHAIIHIVLGIIALGVGIRQNAYGFTVFLGLLLATVGVMRLIPATEDLVINLLNVNEPVAALNMTIGLFGLLIALTDTKSYHTVSH